MKAAPGSDSEDRLERYDLSSYLSWKPILTFIVASLLSVKPSGLSAFFRYALCRAAYEAQIQVGFQIIRKLQPAAQRSVKHRSLRSRSRPR